MLIGIISGKIVGLELFGVLQISYLNLMNHDKLNMNLYPLIDFKFFNGLNFKLVDEGNDQIPSNILDMKMESEFLNNFNVMFFASILALITFYVINRVAQFSKNKSLEKIGINMLKQSAVTLALFNSLNIGFSAGLHLKYSDISSSSSVFHYVSTFALVLVLFSLICLMVILERLESSSFG